MTPPKGEDIKPLVPSAAKRALSNVDHSFTSEGSANGLQLLDIDPRGWCNNSDTSVSRRRGADLNGDVKKAEEYARILGAFVSSANEIASQLGNQYGQTMGPTLEELAAKLQKSNALQILPVRPSVIKQPDSSGESDNHAGNKRIKTEEYGNDYINSANLRNSTRDTSSSSSTLTRKAVVKKPGKQLSPAHVASNLKPRLASEIVALLNVQTPIVRSRTCAFLLLR
jgi:hypothetical protein